MNQQNEPQDIFFFSQKCMFCKEAYDLIQKIGVNKFVFVNVDDDSNIPTFIDRVPSILSSEKKVLVDTGLFSYLNSKLSVDPFMVNEMSKTSDGYSYLDDSQQLNHSYEFLNNPSKIITPTETDVKKILSYEDIMQNRDNDLKVILNK
jgi:hypothetical protein